MPTLYASADFVDLTPTSGFNNWQTKSLSGIVPAGTGGVMLRVYNNTGSNRVIGFQKPAAGALDLTGFLSSLGYDTVFVGLDASLNFEMWITDVGSTGTSDVTVTLVGEIPSDECVFFDTPVQYFPTVGSYASMDLSGDLGADTSQLSFFIGLGSANNIDLHFRSPGSTDDRSLVSAVNRILWAAAIPVSDAVECYRGSSNMAVYHIGYMTSGVVAPTSHPDRDDYSIGAINSWTSMAALPTGSNGGLFEVTTNDTTGATTDYGIRESGDTGDTSYQRPVPGTAYFAAKADDTNRKCDGYIENLNTDMFLVCGFSSGGGGGTTVTKTASLGAILSKQGILRTAQLDAILQQTLTLTSSLDSVLQKTSTKSADLDAILQGTITLTASLDAILQSASGTQVRTASLDAILQKTVQTIASLDAILQKTSALTSQFDSVLILRQTLTASLGAVLSATGLTKTASLDAILEVESGVWTQITDASTTWTTITKASTTWS